MSKMGRVFWGIAIGGMILFFLLVLAIPLSLFGLLTQDMRDIYRGKGDIAVVSIEGPIEDSRSIAETFHIIGENPSVKGVLLRIDSPGGGVAASQELYAEAKKLAQKKTVFVSMGSVAASGGYYIACASQKIYANLGTITGSIGVLMENVDVSTLIDRLYIRNRTLISGDLKDAGSPFRPMTDTEKVYLQSILDQMHEQFIGAVQDSRKLDLDRLRIIADGRVFTGEEAVREHLIDEIGTYYDAFDGLKAALGLTGDVEILSLDQVPEWSWLSGMQNAWGNGKTLRSLMDTVGLTGLLSAHHRFVY